MAKRKSEFKNSRIRELKNTTRRSRIAGGWGDDCFAGDVDFAVLFHGLAHIGFADEINRLGFGRFRRRA
jgi:hypothetical protein